MIKVAFVGCGGIMEEHCKHLQAMDELKLAGYCDIERARAESSARRFGGEAYTNHEEMYDKVKPDAVYVAVPPYAHTRIEEAAAERDIHLFIEKPIALTRDGARRIHAAVRKAKILTSVGYHMRYSEVVARARQILKGKVVSLVTGAWIGGMPEASWWRRMDKSGGQVLEQTTHIVDLLRYLCGEVSEVYASASTGCMTKVKDYDVHDSSVVNLRLKSGASGSVVSSCVAGHDGKVMLEVVTPGATLCLTKDSLVVKEAEKTTEFRSRGNAFAEEDRAFIDAVRAGKRTKIRSTYSDALKTFLVTLAVNESIGSGLPVKP